MTPHSTLFSLCINPPQATDMHPLFCSIFSVRSVQEYSVRASMSSQKWNRYHVPAAPGEEERRKPPTLARMPWENANWERTIQREMVELAAAAKAASTLRADTAKARADPRSGASPPCPPLRFHPCRHPFSSPHLGSP